MRTIHDADVSAEGGWWSCMVFWKGADAPLRLLAGKRSLSLGDCVGPGDISIHP